MNYPVTGHPETSAPVRSLLPPEPLERSRYLTCGSDLIPEVMKEQA
jgi:hypothetical protein